MKRWLFLTLFVMFAIFATAAPIERLMNPYLSMKNALVAGNVEEAKNAAIALHVTLQNKDLFQGTQQAATFPKHQSKLVKLAKAAREAKDLEMLRADFEALSLEFIAMLEQQKNWGMTLHVFYCPMKQAYWISQEKEVRNPYYGKSMLNCGSLKRTIQ